VETVAGIVLMEPEKKVIRTRTGKIKMNKPKATVSWSGGKDCAFSLFKILQLASYEIVSLHTTINSETRRVGLHGVREELIQAQADALGLPLDKLYLPASQSNEAYENVMTEYYRQCKSDGIDFVLFGDIFLEDLKQYRQYLLAQSGLQVLYPLWNLSTDQIIRDFLDADFKTLICSANGLFFDATHVGRTIDINFVERLPPNVDACGENGEFHTFVYDGPIFTKPVNLLIGEVVEKEYSFEKLVDGKTERATSKFWFIDLLSADDKPSLNRAQL
jgi:uncharacterized protein (TIGR00290 family)